MEEEFILTKANLQEKEGDHCNNSKNVKNKVKALLRPEMWVKSKIVDIGYRISCDI